jgi:hypothetical protein
MGLSLNIGKALAFSHEYMSCYNEMGIHGGPSVCAIYYIVKPVITIETCSFLCFDNIKY